MRIPFFVDGFLVEDDNMNKLAQWCGGRVVDDETTGRRYIRVPVERPSNRKQTEAYPGTWIIVSNDHRGAKSYKVYTPEWLGKQFFNTSGSPREIETDNSICISVMPGEYDLAVVVHDIYDKNPVELSDEPADPSPPPTPCCEHAETSSAPNVPTQARPTRAARPPRVSSPFAQQ